MTITIALKGHARRNLSVSACTANVAEAKDDNAQEGDENVDEGNRPANIQLDSPCRSGSGQARWNVPPGTATAGAMSAAKKTSVLPKQVPAGADPALRTKRSTRTQPVRKRKG